MKMIQVLFAIVTTSSTAAREIAANPELSGTPKSTNSPGDRGTANAHLRGAKGAPLAPLQSDSLEGGPFETGTSEFLGCTINQMHCTSASQCCSHNCEYISGRSWKSCCLGSNAPCTYETCFDECCSGGRRTEYSSTGFRRGSTCQ